MLRGYELLIENARNGRQQLSGPLAAPEKPSGVCDKTLPSSVQGRIYKVNHRKAREGPLGDSASRKLLAPVPCMVG